MLLMRAMPTHMCARMQSVLHLLAATHVGAMHVQTWQTRSQKVASDPAAALTDAEKLLYLALRNFADLEAHNLQPPDASRAACATERDAAQSQQQLCFALYADALVMDDTDPLTWLRMAQAARAMHEDGVAQTVLDEALQRHAYHPLLMKALLATLLKARCCALQQHGCMAYSRSTAH